MDVLQIGIGNVSPRRAKYLFAARRYHDQDDTVPPTRPRFDERRAIENRRSTQCAALAG
jgi:hypothetical protein